MLYSRAISTAPKHTIYTQLPFIGSSTTTMPNELLQILGKCYPQIDLKFYFRKSFTIGSFFKNHYPTDIFVRSSLIYQYTCDCCQQSCIGSTALQLFRRCAQHRGISFRTGTMLTRSDNSAIRDYCFNNDHPFKNSNVNIIDSTARLLDLRILESIHIHRNNPEINNYQTATTVNILDIT